MKRRISFFVTLASLGLGTMASAQWQAFNCQSRFGAHSNDTFYTVSLYGNNFGPLRDIVGGDYLPVYLYIADYGTSAWTPLTNAPPSTTPAARIFDGYVSWFDPSGDAPDALCLYADTEVDYYFLGLDPTKRYNLTATVARLGPPGAGAPNYFSNRWTQVELFGAASATPAHSAGIITAAQFPSDLTGNQVAFNSGANSAGDVVEWDNIVPGPNNYFTLFCTKYTGHFLTNNSAARATASYAYTISVIKLEEVETNLTLSVALISPTNGQMTELCSPETMTLALSGQLAEVSYYADDVKFADKTSGCWSSAPLPLLPPGPHNVYACARDTNGNVLYTATNIYVVSPESAANFTRGPFIQNVCSNSAQLIWRTSVPGNSVVACGPTEDLLYNVMDSAVTTNHVVTLSNLASDTTYYYRVVSDLGCGVLTSTNESFHTFKSSGSVSFIVVGDSAGAYGDAVGARTCVAAIMRQQQADLVLHTGDIVEAGFNDDEVGTEFFDAFQAQMKNTPFFLVPGNHDIDYPADHGGMNFQAAFYLPTNSATGTKLFYAFDHGDVHFCCLFNPWFADYVFTAGDRQYCWLTNDLATTSKPWKLLFMHMPLATSSYHARDDYNNNGIVDQVELMNLMLPVAQRYGVQMVFGGHNHCFERFAPTNGLHHVVSGGGGQDLYYFYSAHPYPASEQFWPVHHFLRVAVTNDTLCIQALDTNGVVFDAMTVQKALPPPQLYQASWFSPDIKAGAANNGDGNIVGQRFDFVGLPIYPRAGQFSNLGRVYVNNDATNLYIGFEQVMIWANNNVFLFVESPCLAGVSSMAGLGNGRIDPAGQGADALDCLENLSFTRFSPSIGCVLGDEYGDGQSRSFPRPGLGFNIGQGVFRLDAGLSDVPGARLQQFNRSPETYPTSPDDDGVLFERNADFIELAIPFSALGGLRPGDTIKLGAVAGGPAYSPVAQTRQLDSSVLGYSLTGSGQSNVVLEGVSVRLATDPSLPLLAIAALPSNQYRFSWNARVGTRYDIEYSPTLTNFTSLGVAGLPVTADSTNESFVIVPGESPAGFYRLRILE